MKTNLKSAFLIGVLTCLLACKKSANVNPTTAAGAINITNVVVGGSMITLTTNNPIISANNTIGSNAASFLPLAGGRIQLTLGVPAVAATLTTPAIPAVPYYSSALTVNNSSNYSLFLTGTSISSIDNVLIKESYNRTYADSVCGVRFINLSPGSNPVSVDIQGYANGSEVASIAYKAYSDFIQHPAKAVNSSYVFEFRDATTGGLLTSYTMKTPYFHNVTLCLRGIVGGSVGVTLDNDY